MIKIYSQAKHVPSVFCQAILLIITKLQGSFENLRFSQARSQSEFVLMPSLRPKSLHGNN